MNQETPESGQKREPLPREGTAEKHSNRSPLDFSTLVATYYEALFRFGLALTRCESEAIDLTQHTFYIWACKGHQLRDSSKAKVWLFSVLRHEFLKRKRYEARFVQSESTLESTPCDEETETDSLPAQIDGSAAQEALFGLDDLHREPLVLFYLQQHSYQEIAEILEIPIGTVMSRLWRGKVKLRKLLLGRMERDRETSPQ